MQIFAHVRAFLLIMCTFFQIFHIYNVLLFLAIRLSYKEQTYVNMLFLTQCNEWAVVTRM